MIASLVVAMPTIVAAQTFRNPPRIGYVYPAGLQQGTSVQVTIGGQYLSGTEEVRVSHPGITAKVVRYWRPLTQREINELMDKVQQIRAKAQEEAKKLAFGNQAGYWTIFWKIAAEMGVSREDIQALDGFRRLRNDPKRQVNPQIAEKVFVELSASEDVPIGEYLLRVRSPEGFSNPIRFQVGAWRETLETEPNESTATDLTESPLPVVINGQILPGDVDRFQFHARKGQRLVAAVSARALIPYLADAVPGWFQAVISLLDSDGREFAFADDWRFHPDPVLSVEIPRDGTYTLEVRDAIYRGREDFVYRVVLGQLPFVSSVFPMGGPADRAVELELTGWNLPTNRLLLPPLDRAEGEGLRPDWVRLSEPQEVFNRVLFVRGDEPENFEQEPNSNTDSAQRVTLGVTINGRIDRPEDWDVFCVSGSAGEAVVAEVFARRLGSPLDSVLRITDGAGKLLTSNDDFEDKSAGLLTHQADSYVRFQIPESGTAFIHLGDIQQQGGLEFAYRLRVAQPQPDFELRVVPSTVNAGPGATVELAVYAVRRDGFDGDIHLELVDAPSGFRLSGNWIPAGQETIRCTMNVPTYAEIGEYHFQLAGRAKIGDREIVRTAVPADDQMQAFIYRHLVPADSWLVNITRNRRINLPWVRTAEERLVIPVGGRVNLDLPVGRAAALPAGQLQFQLSEPPPGIKVAEFSVQPSRIRITLVADGQQAKPGLKGNLILEAYTQRTLRPGMPPRLVPVALLPAIPFEVVRR